jgi:DNA-binding NarL/FixJ family response regulator
MGAEAEQLVRVGICDDHPVFRAGVAALIEDEPALSLAFQVGSAAELLAYLASHRDAADVLLLDFDLPDRHGLEILPEVCGHCRVLVLSAFDDPSNIRTALERGAVGFVRKDSPPTALLKALRDACSGRTVLQADVAVKLAGTLRTRSADEDFPDRLAQLTTRQREVLDLLAEGHSNREIAAALFVTEGTVKNHVTQILQIVGAPDRTRLAVLVARHARPRSAR